MTGFSEMPGQGPDDRGNSERLNGFDAEPLEPTDADYPGRALGIVGLVLAFFLNVVGLIVSIVAYSQSRKAGRSNGFAVAGIVVAVLEILIGAVIGIALIGTAASVVGR